MAVHTTDDAIGIVFGLLSSINVPKYRTTKPTKAKDPAYIVINTLPIGPGPMQKCYLNVNYHVPDIPDSAGPSGIKDQVKLQAGSVAVLAILEKVSTKTYLIDLESQDEIRNEAQEEHYSNMRFSFKFINS